MNRESFAIAAKWVLGLAVYMVLSAAISRIFVVLILHWPYKEGLSRLGELEVLVLRRSIFRLCLFCGAFYVSALAKPACFGRTTRILNHLGWTCMLSIVGCVLLSRVELVPLPDFPKMFEVSAYLVVVLTFSFLCFVGAIAAWVHLAFSGKGALTQTAVKE